MTIKCIIVDKKPKANVITNKYPGSINIADNFNDKANDNKIVAILY